MHVGGGTANFSNLARTYLYLESVRAMGTNGYIMKTVSRR